MQPIDQPEGESAVPVAPWRLQGSACLSLWRMPAAELGLLAPDPALPLITLAGNAFLATVWAQYTGGTLSYNELAVAVLVRGKGLLAPAASITAIWVDNAVSAEGGRRLWHIPKALARFQTLNSADFTFSSQMTIDDHATAQLGFRLKTALPGRPNLSGFVVQPSRGGPLRTRCTVSGKLCTGHANWKFSADGPLAVLDGRKPLVTVYISEMNATFGV